MSDPLLTTTSCPAACAARTIGSIGSRWPYAGHDPTSTFTAITPRSTRLPRGYVYVQTAVLLDNRPFSKAMETTL